ADHRYTSVLPRRRTTSPSLPDENRRSTGPFPRFASSRVQVTGRPVRSGLSKPTVSDRPFPEELTPPLAWDPPRSHPARAAASRTRATDRRTPPTVPPS